MKATFFLLLSVLFLSSCQVPTSVSTASTNLIGSDLKISLPPLIVGLDGPTWETHEAAVDSKGWSHPIDDTYTRVKTSRKVIAITFDDGPHPENTPRLLDMLKERKIKATFYVVGDMVKYSPQLLRRMVAEGHEIGNHTVSHGTLSRMSNDSLIKELKTAHEQILHETGVAPRTMRPPGGAIKKDQKALMMEELGYPTILWSVDPLDWKRPGPAVVTSRLLNGASPGGILLVHDLHKPTVDAMPSTLDQLLAQGYEFVTISELIELDETER
ncbi:MAG: polysaccharide deacetylase family protein [Verrucomicrobiales bacterium]|jgi:peptidoglycan/xylan/chitin deacetylase (PgdA/CDA1 family)|nr:polysaccharide deacetylase family protein [Verrucomicrobiales bacterium]MBP9223785.1 polysaccharide deacetylase family protein [Verrucomicrobiales bacterium]